MTAAVYGAETDNGITHESSPVICNWCKKDYGETNRRQAHPSNVHCRTCHGFGHRACIVCGACISTERKGWYRKRNVRLDRLYCSSTCRVHGLKQREQKRVERQIWEAEHPEEAAKEKAEEEAIIARYKAINAQIPSEQRRIQHEKRSRELAASPRCWTCNVAFSSEAVIYLWREPHRIETSVLPYCAEHRCGMSRGNHNRDAPPGYHYDGCSCDDSWWQFSTCPGCNHPIAYQKRANWLRQRDWSYSGEKGRLQKPRVFCSTTCKANVLRVERRAAKLARRAGRLAVVCPICLREFNPRRAGAAYCSNACRQRAYRARERQS